MEQVSEIVEKPKVIRPILENIPSLLKEHEQWVLWKFVYKPEIEKKPWAKIPIDPATNKYASSTKPKTWRSYEVAEHFFQDNNDVDGIGYVLNDRGIVGVDLDKCRNIDTGIIDPWATAIIQWLNSYTEVSPSGTGIRIFVKGTLPTVRNRNGTTEMYVVGRYLTLTGNRIEGTPADICNRHDEIRAIHKEIFFDAVADKKEKKAKGPAVRDDTPLHIDDEEVFEVASRNEKFCLLWQGDWQSAGDYPSQSEADYALAGMLVRYCGPDGAEQVDRMFRRSGLYREEKWDRLGESVIEGLISKTDNDDYYKWNRDVYEFNLDDYINAKDPITKSAVVDEEPDDFVDVPRPEKIKEKDKKAKKRSGVLDCDIAKLPDAEPIVDQFIDVETLNCFFGDTNVGKSFVTLDLANSIARGIPFLNHYRTFEAFPTAYIYAEGRRGLKKRLMAWRKHRRQGASDNLVFLPHRYILNDTDENELNEALQECTTLLGKEPKVLFVDTLSKNMEGDENGKDMTQLVNRLSDLITQKNMTVIVVHHTGKDASKGARGNSSLKGGIDSEFKVAAKDDIVEIINDKARDSAYTNICICEKTLVQLGNDKYGRPITSLAFTHKANDYVKPDKPLSKDDQLKADIMEALTGNPATANDLAKAVKEDVRNLNRVLPQMRMDSVIGFDEYKVNGKKAYRYYKLKITGM